MYRYKDHDYPNRNSEILVAPNIVGVKNFFDTHFQWSIWEMGNNSRSDRIKKWVHHILKVPDIKILLSHKDSIFTDRFRYLGSGHRYQSIRVSISWRSMVSDLGQPRSFKYDWKSKNWHWQSDEPEWQSSCRDSGNFTVFVGWGRAKMSARPDQITV